MVHNISHKIVEMKEEFIMNINGKKFISLENYDKVEVLKSIASILLVISMDIFCIVAIIIGDKYCQYKAIMTAMCLVPLGVIIIAEEAEDIKKTLNKTTLR